MKNIPIYQISISDEYSEGEDLGIKAIAFTSNPAIKIKGVAFSAVDEKKQVFVDKVKYRITAPIMTPSTIFRSDETGDYYVQFSANEIDRIYSKYMKNLSNRNVFNLEHNVDEKVPAYILESWIVNEPTKDKSLLEYGIDVPAGSVMMTAQITNPDVYNQLIDNEQFAFSIEGFLGMALSDIIIKKNNIEEKMNQQKFNMPDGEYEMNDKIYVIKDGQVVEVKDIAMAVAPESSAEEAKEETPEQEKKEQEQEMADAVPPADPNAPLVPDAPSAEDKADVYTKEEIDAKFDELYQMLAEIKAAKEIAPQDVVPVQQSAQKMSAFEAYRIFTKSQKMR